MTAADPSLAPFAQALLDDSVKLAGDKVILYKDDKYVDASTGAEIAELPEGTEDIVTATA